MNSLEILKIQLEILISYINSTDSKTIFIHLIFELSEILIILKRNLLKKILSYGDFKYNCKTLRIKRKVTEINEDSKNSTLNKSLFELFGIYLELISILINKSNIGKNKIYILFK